jgi:NAD(P)-dependent dehydrogenase (short-subunit alcohol dehydrogenase family)
MKPKVAVITGASSGIGRAAAIEFARHGWRVALLARGRAGLQGALRDVEAAGGEGTAIRVDVAYETEVEAAAAAVEARWGDIDVWVNCAMASAFCEADAIEPEEFRRITEVTYLGAVWGTLAALKRMRPKNRGTIIQVGSALAYRSIPMQSAYCGAKAGLRGFTDSLRSELTHGRSAVRLTMLNLAAFNTPQFDVARNRMAAAARPLGKVFQPEVAARAIYWAALHRRRELSVGWPALQAILGTRVVPGLLDWYLGKTAVKGQQRGEPPPERRLDNLYQPVPGDRGSHGPFDGEALDNSAQLWASTHRGWLAATACAALAAVVFAKQRHR